MVKIFIFHLSNALKIVSILLVVIGLVQGCAKPPEKTKLEKQTYSFLKKMEDSAIELEHTMDDISKMKRLNSPGRLKSAIKIVNSGEKKLTRANNDVSQYIKFIGHNAKALDNEGLNHYVAIEKILNQFLTEKRTSMATFFNKMKVWLEYSVKHFNQLEAGNQAIRRNYDIYLTEVNRSLKKYNLANEKYHLFINSFLKENPNLIKHFKPQYKTMKKEMGWL